MTAVLERAERTLTTRKGKVVVTNLTDAEAISGLRELTSDFARDLIGKHDQYGRLSADQMTWVHALVIEARKPGVQIGDMAGVIELFRTAATHLKYPKVRLQTADGREIKLWLAGVQSSAPGSVSVKCGDTFIGRVMPDGNWQGRSDEAIVALLREFAQSPADVASKYGKLTGACCFCATDLTDPRSLAVGYGPICADHYGLPWGTR